MTLGYLGLGHRLSFCLRVHNTVTLVICTWEGIMMVTFRHLNVGRGQIGVCRVSASLQVFGVFVTSGGSLLKSLDADTGGSLVSGGRGVFTIQTKP